MEYKDKNSGKYGKRRKSQIRANGKTTFLFLISVVFVGITYSQFKRNGQTYNPDGIEMVYVEGNGSSIKGFYIGKYEITQKEWTAVMGDNPSENKGDNLPVERVSWDDVQEFIRRLNQKTGRNYRLPTDAEWEYAAKGGPNNNTYEYSGSNNIDEVAWYTGNSVVATHNIGEGAWALIISDIATHTVGTKKPNSVGIYDMSGNVWELCQDKCSYDNETKEIVVDEKGLDHVCRGGGCYDYAPTCRIAFRDNSPTWHIGGDLGFRVALP